MNKQIFRAFLFALFSVMMAQTVAAQGIVIFNKDSGFSLSQNKLVDGRRNLRAVVDFELINFANADAKATLRLEDMSGNLLTTTEGKATKSRSLNLKNNDDATFSMKFDMPNNCFLTNSRIGKQLRAKFILKINGEEVLNVYKEFTAKNSVSSGSGSQSKSSGSGKASKSNKSTTPKATKKSTPNSGKSKSTRKSAPKSNNHSRDRYMGDNSQWEETCTLCAGTGRCNTCGGAGQYFSQAAGTMWPCSSCYSSGQCRMCQGKGKNVYRVYTVNGIRYMQVNTDAPRVLGSGGDDGHRCGACSGMGRCAVCQGSGYGTSYTGTPPLCNACGGTGRCSKCGGSGWR